MLVSLQVISGVKASLFQFAYKAPKHVNTNQQQVWLIGEIVKAE